MNQQQAEGLPQDKINKPSIRQIESWYSLPHKKRAIIKYNNLNIVQVISLIVPLNKEYLKKASTSLRNRFRVIKGLERILVSHLQLLKRVVQKS